jgi:hypothetical protein
MRISEVVKESSGAVPEAFKEYHEKTSRDQGALDSLGHLCERSPAGVRDPHAHNIGLSIVGDHALTLRGCEAGLDQFDHHVHREPVRTQDRLAVPDAAGARSPRQ